MLVLTTEVTGKTLAGENTVWNVGISPTPDGRIAFQIRDAQTNLHASMTIEVEVLSGDLMLSIEDRIEGKKLNPRNVVILASNNPDKKKDSSGGIAEAIEEVYTGKWWNTSVRSVLSSVNHKGIRPGHLFDPNDQKNIE